MIIKEKDQLWPVLKAFLREERGVVMATDLEQLERFDKRAREIAADFGLDFSVSGLLGRRCPGASEFVIVTTEHNIYEKW